jgi:hypothetical protein
MYKTVYTEVEVDVDLTDFDTDDLIEELESRGSLPVEQNGDAKELVQSIYLKRRLGQDYQHELDKLIYQVTGKII